MVAWLVEHLLHKKCHLLTKVRIPLRTCDYEGEIVTKKQLYPALTFSIYRRFLCHYRVGLNYSFTLSNK